MSDEQSLSTDEEEQLLKSSPTNPIASSSSSSSSASSSSSSASASAANNTHVPYRAPTPKLHSAASSNSTPRVTNQSRKGFFGFFRSHSGTNQSSSQSNLLAHKRGQSANSSSSSSSSSSIAVSSSSTATAATRRRWFRYPVRVPILSLLLVSFLARTSEGWNSIAGFACGFLLFEAFSAPDTGQPNRIDTIVRSLLRWCKTKKKKHPRRLQASGEPESSSSAISTAVANSRIIHFIRMPFMCCLRRCLRRHAQSGVGNLHAGQTQALLQAAEEEEDSDVLLDVSVSVTDDTMNSPKDSALDDAVSSTSVASSSSASSSSSSTTSSASSSSELKTDSKSDGKPLHPLTEIAETTLTDITERAIEAAESTLTEAIQSLPTVSSLDPADVATPTLTSSHSTVTASKVVGANVSWHHMSVSLRFTLYNFHIHLHHWVYLLIICLFLFLEQNLWKEQAASFPVYAFASSFCLGGSVQGLKYADWHHVISRIKKSNNTPDTPATSSSSSSSSSSVPKPKRERRNSRSSILINSGASKSSSSSSLSVQAIPSALDTPSASFPNSPALSPTLSPTLSPASIALGQKMDEIELGMPLRRARSNEGRKSEDEDQEELKDIPSSVSLARANSANNANDTRI